MSASILVIEDEADLLGVLEYNLRRAGYRPISVTSGEAGLRLALAQPPDLIVLDLMLPDLSGLEVARRLRAEPHTARVPILMLTAMGTETDRVVGFEAGADDYVVKPFSVRELMLRVAAILRRAVPSDDEAGARRFGILRVDASAHRVWVGDDEVQLTALELRLLDTLLERRGRVQSREVLLRDVWDIHADITTRTVDTHVKRLREKIGRAGPYVETVRGVGYRFRAEPGELVD